MYLSGHPMEQYTLAAQKSGCVPIINIISGRVKDGGRVRIMGVLDGVRTRQIKTGNILAATSLADVTGAVDITVFSAAYEVYKQYLSKGAIVEISGRVSEREDRNTEIICESVRPVDETAINTAEPARLKIRVSGLKGVDFLAAQKILERFPGNMQVIVFCRDTGKRMLAPERLSVNGDDRLIYELKSVLGDKNVKVE